MNVSSTPTLAEFNPNDIPYQYKVIHDVRKRFDYDLGVHELLFSGAVGSAKTVLLAHLCVTHCLLYPGAFVGVGRRTWPALKETLWNVILEHLGSTTYKHNMTDPSITFPNKSKIMGFSWKDRNFKKFRSYEFSAFAVEELTDNDEDDFLREVKMRVGRLRHVREKWIAYATNPDEPDHEVAKYFGIT